MKRQESVVGPAEIALVVSGAISVVLGFGVGLSFLLGICILMSVVHFNTPRMLTYLMILVAVDPVVRTYVMVGGIFRYNTLNYIMVFLVGYNLLSGQFVLRPILAYLIFLAAVILGVLQSADLRLATLNILALFTFWGCFCVLYSSYLQPGFSAELKKGLIRGIMASALFSVLFFYSFGMNVFSEYRFESIGEKSINRNSFAYLPIAGVIFSTVLSKLYHIRLSLLLPVQALLMYLVMISGSRGGLTIGAIAIYMVLPVDVLIKRSAVILGTCLLLTGFGHDLLESSNIFALQRLSYVTSDRSNLAEKTSGRSEIAIIGFKIFQTNPITGAGTGSFRKSFGNLTRNTVTDSKDYLYNMQGNELAAHSAYVKVLAENGIIGSLLFLGFLVSVLRAKTTHSLQYMALGILLVALLWTEFNAKAPWLLCALVFVLHVREQHILKSAASRANDRQMGKSMESPVQSPA